MKELLFSFARDARFNNRPWRRPLAWLMVLIRKILGHCLVTMMPKLEKRLFDVFVAVAALDDILEFPRTDE
jgi:hypothetical protein